MKAVSEIRKDSIRITDKEGYDVKNIKQKNRKSCIGKKKKKTYKLIFQFSKKKKKLSLQERQLKCILSSPKLSRRKLLKIEVYKKLTHATCNVTFCINIQVQNTPLSQKLEPEHFY